jgi:polysaccharide biosynthesis transport protein
MVLRPNLPPPPPAFSTRLVDRINFAIQLEKAKDVFLKRWWIIAICTLIPLVYASYKAYQKPDIYQASGTMIVSPRLKLPISDGIEGEAGNFYGTQIQLMQSARVTEAAKARLREDPSLPTPSYVTLSVYQERGTAMFRFVSESTSAEYARRFVDQVMEEYRSLKRKMRDETSDNIGQTVLNAINKLKKELDQADQEMLDFQKEHNMAYVDVQSNSAAQYLADLHNRLANLRTELQYMEAQIRDDNLLLQPRHASLHSAPATSPVGSSEPVIGASVGSQISTEAASLQSTITLLKAEKQDLLRSYQPKHPRILKIDEEIELKQRMFNIVIQQAREQLAVRRESLLKQESALLTAIQDWEKRALDSTQKNNAYYALKEKKGRTAELYNILLRRMDEIDVSTDLGQDSVSIGEPARAGLAPVGPNRTKEVISAGLFGIAIAVGIILLLEKFDDRVKTLDDLQDLLNESVLGQIPMMPYSGKNEGPLFIPDLPNHNTFAESFRNVRSSLMFSPDGGKAKRIVVTSAIPNDGKTTCAVNLATSLAQIEGGKTLLIDADMRKMNIHTYFKMENGPGLSEVLSGQATLEDCVVQTTVSNLYLLRAGEAPPNPGELILSEAFKNLMLKCDESYARVVLDTPPVLSTDDALSLSPTVDGVIFVVKANQTSVRFIQRSIALLRQRGANIFGVILNQIDTNSAHYYYYYYYTGYYNYSHESPDGLKKPMKVA